MTWYCSVSVAQIIVILSSGFFRDRLASAFDRAVPLIVLEGFVTDQESGRRASRVQVYGVDDRFWHFHELDVEPLTPSEAMVSEGLAAELLVDAGPIGRPSRRECVSYSDRVTAREERGRWPFGEADRQGRARARKAR